MDGCEEYAELLSEYLDGELGAPESARVEWHLQQCPACREVLTSFQTVDRMVGAGASLPAKELEARIRAAVLHVPGRRIRPVRSLARLAAAALVLIAFSLTVLVTGDRADARRAAVPIATLEVLNDQAQQDQDALLQTFEWELRSLRVQIDCLEAGEESQNMLRERVERLLRRVQETRETNPGGLK
ncbi:MAG: anti-sigma factor [Planctomycetota bacterium]